MCIRDSPKPAQKSISQVRPGLSGVGSVVFRGEEEMMHGHSNPNWFYDNVIMPYKGQLEQWYVEKQGLVMYLSLIAITIWAIIFSRSRIIWRVFKSLPPRPASLDPFLGDRKAHQ